MSATAETDLSETLRHLDAAALFLSSELDGECEGRDPITPEFRADMADLVRTLARKAHHAYHDEVNERAKTAEKAPPAD